MRGPNGERDVEGPVAIDDATGRCPALQVGDGDAQVCQPVRPRARAIVERDVVVAADARRTDRPGRAARIDHSLVIADDHGWQAQVWWEIGRASCRERV